ncbi:hypothetical protein [Niveibacterium terrae]|uniref:hypothetical protein n=1 Tax=Niveibacterium terrae TaxID=3373598 RepID=UPI003A936A19
MKFSRHEVRTLSLAATVFAVVASSSALAAGMRILPQRDTHPDPAEERRDEPKLRHQERHGLREELRQSQREGLTPAVGFDSGYESRAPRRMSPEERRQLRREINDAAHKLYGER